MHQYLIIFDDNRSILKNAEATGEGSSYSVAKTRALVEAQRLADEAGADYVSRWSEQRRNTSANDDRWQFIGEYCK